MYACSNYKTASPKWIQALMYIGYTASPRTNSDLGRFRTGAPIVE